jgi:hypothetical protein
MTQSTFHRNARLACLLYLLSLLTAIIGEFVVHGIFGIDHQRRNSVSALLSSILTVQAPWCSLE